MRRELLFGWKKSQSCFTWKSSSSSWEIPNWTVTWIPKDWIISPDFTFWTAGKMIHNTLKSPQLSDHNHRRTNSAAQRKLWRYSGCRGGNQVESHRRSVCVLAADLNAGDGGGRGGEGVMHTIHGLCHLCIGCRLPQVCLLGGIKQKTKRRKMWYEEGQRSGSCCALH